MEKNVAVFGVGQAVPRKEDDRLRTGPGHFQDEIDRLGQAHAAIPRSTRAAKPRLAS